MGGGEARRAYHGVQEAIRQPLWRRVAEVFGRVVALQQRVQHYRDLGGFVVLMAFFITILYMQADSSRSYEITAAHAVLFPPVCPSPTPIPALLPCMLPLTPLRALSPPPCAPPFTPTSHVFRRLPHLTVCTTSCARALCARARQHYPWPLASRPLRSAAPFVHLLRNSPHSLPLNLRPECVSPRPPREQGMRQDASNTFNGPDDFYNWLNTSILQSLWADPRCGTGLCERPFQYPAFGRFGCEADCGIFPNLTSVVIRLSSQLDTQQAADKSSWNLCMVNPVSLCWYARPPPASLCSY
ncbi:unnamed protein product [Closterium sp. Yama58-4]|nr:unnamed protein product [Closterium sp. Yama58-4]